MTRRVFKSHGLRSPHVLFMFPCLLLKFQLVWIDFELFGQHSFVVDLNHTVLIQSTCLLLSTSCFLLHSTFVVGEIRKLPCPWMKATYLMNFHGSIPWCSSSHLLVSLIRSSLLWLNFPYFSCLISNFCWFNPISWVRLSGSMVKITVQQKSIISPTVPASIGGLYHHIIIINSARHVCWLPLQFFWHHDEV